MTCSKLISATIFVFISTLSNAFSQSILSPTEAALKKYAEDSLARVTIVDTAVPQSPAFTILNVTTETAVRARSPDELATSLLNNVDQNGNFQTGLAVDFSPSELFSAETITLEAYRKKNNWATRAYANTQISIATTQGQSKEDEATRIALGLHVTPWISEASDPRRNDAHLDCFRAAADFVLEEPMEREILNRQKDAAKKLNDAAGLDPERLLPGQKLIQVTDGTVEGQALRREITNEALTKFKKGEQDCIGKWKKAHKAMTAWTIGVTPTWTSKNKNFDDLEWSGVALWSSLALDLKDLSKLPLVGRNGEAVFHVRYRSDEVIPDDQNIGSFFEQDTFLASAKMRFEPSVDGPEDMFKDVRYSLEGAYVNADRKGAGSDDYFLWSGKAEFRVPQIADNLWLNITLGRSSGRDNAEETYGGLNVSWAFNDKTAK